MIRISHPVRIALALGIFALLIMLAFHIYARYAFSRAYQQYASIAQRHDDAAYIPGVADNEIRKELNIVLARVLSEEMTPQDRLSLARRGQALLEAAEVQIDAIGEIGTEVSLAIQIMRASADIPGGFHVEDDIRSIIEDAEKRFSIIGDVRGLSYRAQFTTGQIFRRVIDDQGELDAAYVAELNRELPEVEAQYNMRTNFYSDLEKVKRAIDDRFAELKNVF